ncbi:MAG: hypothetical protein ACYTEK_15640 [Planctomycetota bacterium]|jgi:hypothetical protein
MRIKWENIIVLVLIITLIVLLFKLPPLLRRLSEDLGTVYYHNGDPAIGLLALGIICITVLGIVKIISGNRR